MPRKHKNIKMQLHEKINSLLKIGEKKPKGKTKYIHSIKTAETYRRTADQFSEFLKKENIRVKSIDDIKKEHLQAFFDSRKKYSPYSLSRENSALNKILGTSYTKADFNIPKRNIKNCKNNRGLAKNDTSHRESQKPILDFVEATGIRKSSIPFIKPSQAIRDATGQVIGFTVKEKGGRTRNAICTLQGRSYVNDLINNHIKNYGIDAPLFPKGILNNSNPHWQRAEYCKILYDELKTHGDTLFNNMRSTFVNEEHLKRSMSRYKADNIKGYDKELCGICSQMLGHARIEVLKSYLWK